MNINEEYRCGVTGKFRFEGTTHSFMIVLSRKDLIPYRPLELSAGRSYGQGALGLQVGSHRETGRNGKDLIKR